MVHSMCCLQKYQRHSAAETGDIVAGYWIAATFQERKFPGAGAVMAVCQNGTAMIVLQLANSRTNETLLCLRYIYVVANAMNIHICMHAYAHAPDPQYIMK